MLINRIFLDLFFSKLLIEHTTCSEIYQQIKFCVIMTSILNNNDRGKI